MTFDDVNVPAFSFVIVTFIVALIGNTLVLIVFGWRWRTTNDTKIYIMALAVLDLACTLVSSPRDVISLFPAGRPCPMTRPAMLGYCRASVFLTNHLNLASALILLAIATSRYVKVTKGDHGGTEGTDPGRACHALRSCVKRLARAVSTVRGAKVASVVAFCVSFVKCSPSLVIYGSGSESYAPLLSLNSSDASTLHPSNVSETSPLVSSNALEMSTLMSFNVSETSTLVFPGLLETDPNGTTEEGQFACPRLCSHLVHSRYRKFSRLFQTSQFVLFVILALLLIGIYGAILQKLCQCRQNSGSDPARRNSAALCPAGQHWDVLELSQQQETDGGKPGNRTVITTDTVTADGESLEPASPSSTKCLVLNDSRPADETPVTQLSAQTDHVQYRKNDSQPLTFVPPLSSRSDHGSALSLSRQTSQTRSVTKSNERLSTASFQLTKTGNRARLTTLVFFMVTFIYILSYCPFFVMIMYQHVVGRREPWREWETSSQAFALICLRSYLIANAANPLVYGLGNPYFRTQLGKLLICRRDVI
ncbi:uncharacterized protein LOC143290907 [Babylonia areolata]|uniref:uncharacterized protein LOC143290907 n=1 Tax=Babylonia areolata TaxID=304850 RepID=UPI003FCFD5C8